MRFALLVCGHWIADPLHVLRVAVLGPCPSGDGDEIVIALPETPATHMVTPHLYLSTGCLHGRHDYCQSPKGDGGREKMPASCKFCGSPCTCSCHRETQ